MRWQGRRASENVEDRRRSRAPMAVGGGLGVIVLALVVALLGGDHNRCCGKRAARPFSLAVTKSSN